MRLLFNYKLLVAVLALLAGLATGTHFLHSAQMKRHAGVLLVKAQQAEEQGETDKALDYYRRYLAYRRGDIEAKIRFALLLDKSATAPEVRVRMAERVLDLFEEILRADPDRRDIRRRAVEVALEPSVQRYPDAEAHLKILKPPSDGDNKRPLSKEDGELEGLRAQCLERQGKYDEADKSYQEAEENDPTNLETFRRHVTLLQRQLKKPKQADAVVDKLLKLNPSAQAHLLAASYWNEFGTKQDDAARAAKELEKALESAPNDVEILLAAAAFDQQKAAAADDPKLAESRQLLERARSLKRDDFRIYQAQARVERQAGRTNEAVKVLRDGLKALPDHPELLWELADLLVQVGEPTEVKQLIGRMRGVGVQEGRLGLLEGKLLAKEEKWLQAANALEAARPDLKPWPNLVQTCDLLLGDCCGQIGAVDRQLSAYQRVVQENPLSLSGRLGLALVLESVGRPDDALALYPRLVADSQATEVRRRMVQLLMRRNAGLPPAGQHWDEAEKLMRQMEKDPNAAVDLAILRADELLVKGKKKDARNLLEQVQKEHPRDVKVWVALAVLLEGMGEADTIPALLTKAEKTVGDRVELRLARADYCLRHQDKNTAQVLEELAQNRDKFSRTDQRRLVQGLAQAWGMIGNREAATRLWRSLAEQQPDDMRIWAALFDLAQLSQDSAAADQALAQLRRIGGPDGIFWRYGRAIRLVEQAGPEDSAKLAEARKFLEEVGTRRPNWSRVPLLEAVISEREGDKGRAIARYQKAIELGEGRLETIRHVVQLLHEQKRYVEAEQLLKNVPEEVAQEGNLFRLEAEVSLFAGKNPKRTVELARKAVRPDSKNYQDHLFLGQILSQNPGKETEEEKKKRLKEAENELQLALRLRDNVPETWLALVRFLADKKDQEGAEKLLVEAAKKLPPESSRLALAEGYEIVGRIDRAGELYKEARKAKPSDAAVLSAVAGFYLRQQNLDEGKKCLEQILALNPGEAEVRRAKILLAYVLVQQGGRQQNREALALLGVLDALPLDKELKAMPAEEVRARAVLLATQPEDENRHKSIQLLEGLAARGEATQDDRFLLARLQQATGNWREAEKQVLSLLATDESPRYLAFYIQGALENGDATTALLFVRKLEKALPDALPTVQLKARVLKAVGQKKAAVELAKKYAKKYAESKDAQLLPAAFLLEELDDLIAAEEAFRNYGKQVNKPEANAYLAQFLGRHGETGKALDLCESMAKQLPAASVAADVLRILYDAADPKPYIPRARRWLEQVSGGNTTAPEFSFHFAALLNLEEKYGEAEALYRQMIDRDPKNVLALNNLAYLLALHEKKFDEALQLLDKAEEVIGPSPTIQGTRGIVYLTMDRAADALQEMKKAIGRAPTAIHYATLARAYYVANGPTAAQDARRALNKADELKLRPSDIHPLEQQAYKDLRRELRQPSTRVGRGDGR